MFRTLSLPYPQVRSALFTLPAKAPTQGPARFRTVLGSSVYSSQAAGKEDVHGNTLVISGCPLNTSPDELGALLSFPATVLSASANANRAPFRAIFENAEDARAALSRHSESPLLVRGQAVRMSTLYQRPPKPPSRVLHVNNFPDWATRWHVANALGVRVKAVSIIKRSQMGRNCFVDFGSTESAQAAFARHRDAPATVDSQVLALHYSDKRIERGTGPAPTPWLSVSRLPRDATREQLAGVLGVPLEAVGPIVNGKSGPCTRITTPDSSYAQEIYESCRAEPILLDDTPLSVVYSSTSPPQPTNLLKFLRVKAGPAALSQVLKPFEGTFTMIKHAQGPAKQNTVFVEFNDIESATEALDALVGATLPNGKLLIAGYAENMPAGEDKETQSPLSPEGAAISKQITLA